MPRPSHDREILRLALPALGALAAEPLYLLADTAIVGHLGTLQLAALALAGTALGSVVGLCNFLAYGTTAQVARLHGAGEHERAGELAAQALWLAGGVGLVLALACVALAAPIMAVLGGSGATASAAARYLRIGAAGLPFALLAMAGEGFLRGVGRLRVPLVVLVLANAANVAIELALVYGLGLGLDGSALGTVAVQAGTGVAFAFILLRAPARSRRPVRALLVRLGTMGGQLVVRTAALLSAFTLAGAVLARTSNDALAAHLIAFQLFNLIALLLDAIAIAGQVIVGRLLGAGDPEQAWAAARRMVGWSLIVGFGWTVVLLAGSDVIPRAFTSDQDVLTQAARLWPLLALLFPVGGIVFALDGILIGAGDTRFVARAMLASLAAFAPVALASLAFGWGVVGVWAALHVLMLARLATMAHRFAGRRWAVAGLAA